MSRFKYRTGSEREREAAAAIAGGDLEGADFRAAKRDINRQRRTNRRALRRAERKGGDAADYGYEAFTSQEKAANEYFKDLHKGRTARIAGGTALAAGAVLAAPAIGGALAGKGAAAAGTKAAGIGTKLKAAGAKLKPILSDAKKLQGYANAASSIMNSLQPQQLPSMPMPMPQVNPMDFSQFYGMPSPEQFNSMAPSMPPYNNQMYQNFGLGLEFPQFQTPNPYLYQ
jgi:hypothetical protein